MARCSHPGIEGREDVMLPAGQHKGVREIEGGSARSARIWRWATRRSSAPCGREGSADAEVKRGLRYARPQIAQAPRLEVPAGGLLLAGVALALKIRHIKISILKLIFAVPAVSRIIIKTKITHGHPHLSLCPARLLRVASGAKTPASHTLCLLFLKLKRAR